MLMVREFFEDENGDVKFATFQCEKQDFEKYLKNIAGNVIAFEIHVTKTSEQKREIQEIWRYEKYFSKKGNSIETVEKWRWRKIIEVETSYFEKVIRKTAEETAEREREKFAEVILGHDEWLRKARALFRDRAEENKRINELFQEYFENGLTEEHSKILEPMLKQRLEDEEKLYRDLLGLYDFTVDK